MSVQEKHLSKVLIFQTLSRFLVLGLSFFTAPVFTRLLSPADYGQLATYHAWISFVGIFIGLRTYDSLALARVKYSAAEFDKYSSSSMSISFLSFVAVFPLSYIFRKELGRLLNFPDFLIPLIIVQAFFSYCLNFNVFRLIQQKKVEKTSLISILKSVLDVLLALFFIIRIHNSYLFKIYSEIVVVGIFGFLSLLYILYKGKSLYNRYYWQFCLAYSLPLVLHGASGIVFTQSDRIMLKALNGPSEAGIYSLVYTLATVLDILKGAFSSTWEPFYYDFKKNNDKNLVIYADSYLQNFTFIVISFIFCAPEVFKMYAPKIYWTGINFLPIIATAFFFNFLYTFPSLYEFYSKKTKSIAVISFITAATNIVLNYFFIPIYGGLGATITTLISFIISFLLHAFNVKYILKANNYDYTYTFYLKGIIPITVALILFYFISDFWIIRWLISSILGIFLLCKFIKKRSFI